jgi:DivIVA domain-containing protein
VTTVLIYLVVMAVVAGVVFLAASLLFGRGEELAPLPPGSSPTRLPASGVTERDIQELRFQQVFRGYKMSEVDWALDRVGRELAELRARVAELEERLGPDEAVETGAAQAGTTHQGTAR